MVCKRDDGFGNIGMETCEDRVVANVRNAGNCMAHCDAICMAEEMPCPGTLNQDGCYGPRDHSYIMH